MKITTNRRFCNLDRIHTRRLENAFSNVCVTKKVIHQSKRVLYQTRRRMLEETILVNHMLSGTLLMRLALTCKTLYTTVLDVRYARLMELRATVASEDVVSLDLDCFRRCGYKKNLVYLRSKERVHCCDCLYICKVRRHMVEVFERPQRSIPFETAGSHHSLWKSIGRPQ